MPTISRKPTAVITNAKTGEVVKEYHTPVIDYLKTGKIVGSVECRKTGRLVVYREGEMDEFIQHCLENADVEAD